jgi:hypothetical protein
VAAKEESAALLRPLRLHTVLVCVGPSSRIIVGYRSRQNLSAAARVDVSSDDGGGGDVADDHDHVLDLL